jgi:hypothetical protein
MNKTAPATLASAALALLLGAAGCTVEQNYDAKITTAEGDTVLVPMAVHDTSVSDGVVKVQRFQYLPVTLPDGAKELQIGCEAVFTGNARPASIVVTDVTEAPILTVFDDRAPKMALGNHWVGLTAPLGPSDDLISFLSDIDNSIRIYRCRFTLTDGSTHVLSVPVIMPGVLKAVIRSRLTGS